MGWDIKLKTKVKTKENANFTRTIFKNFLWKVVLLTIAIPLLFFLLFFIIQNLDFQWLFELSPNIYFFVNDSFQTLFSGTVSFILAFLLWLIFFLIFLYQALKKVSLYTKEIENSIEKLFDKDLDYVELPKELKELEQKINFLKREKEKNERLARENEQKKDELIVYLAHDIKTPLTSMIGYLSILDEMDDMPKKQQQKYIGIALEKSYRLEDLINELFDIARFNSEKILLEKEELNLNLMLEQIIDDFYPVLKEEKKTIRFQSQEKITLFADPDKLSRVFNNLLKNAINYSPEKSEITIAVQKPEKEVCIAIMNRGKQIPKEKLSKIFEKFYRLDSSRTSRTGGSGLGLAIAKEIVELHGGTIEAQSTEQETTFQVHLPYKED